MNKTIKKAATGEIVLARAHWCASYWCHLRGLMFRRQLPEDEGLLFVTGGESIMNTSIHMLFMFFPIAVVWLNRDLQVVDKKFAKTWRPAYAPAKAAQYYIEANPSLLDRVEVGDVLTFED